MLDQSRTTMHAAAKQRTERQIEKMIRKKERTRKTEEEKKVREKKKSKTNELSKVDSSTC